MDEMDTDIYEAFKTFLPAYLTPEQKADLYAELDRFPENTNYFLQGRFGTDVLQGDGWNGLYLSNVTTKENRRVKGIILSNSCDISLENSSDRPRKLIFSPLLRLEAYREFLLKHKEEAAVNSVMDSIRQQKITYIFYLPASGDREEAIAVFDDVSSISLNGFIESKAEKLFTLSQYGFYIFLLKLSIHFTRFQEGIQRFPEDSATAPAS